jgi:hypothetical protein
MLPISSREMRAEKATEAELINMQQYYLKEAGKKPVVIGK